LDARLTFLDKLLAEISTGGEQSATNDDGSLNARWQALPIANDARVAKTLTDRFEAYRRTESATRSAVTSAAASADAEAMAAAKQAERAAFEAVLVKEGDLVTEGAEMVKLSPLAKK
jgi:hypothetical protein